MLRDVFSEQELYTVIFFRFLPQKKIGMTRDEIVEAGKLTSSGMLTKVLDELECCGFIRKYNSYGKKTKLALYQLIDNYTLFPDFVTKILVET